MIFENSVKEEKAMKFPVWMEVEIGGVPKEELVALLKSKGFSVGELARNVIRQDAFTVSPIKRTLKLAHCKVRDLGFTSAPTIIQLQERLIVFGGELCPAEVGPHLRRQIKEQERGDIFWLFMKPIADSDGYRYVFLLYRDVGSQWLSTDNADPDDQWSLNEDIVFVLAE